MNAAPRYLLSRFVPPGGCFHLARTAYAPGQECPLHRHDFAELFWIERGEALHEVNGQAQVLEPGHLLLIRPDDAHLLRTRRGGGFVLVNVAFASEVIDFIRDRYFDGRANWPGAGDALPARWALAPSAVPQLADRVERLSMARQSRLDLECFLLRVFQMLRDLDSGGVRPSWLAQACERFSQRPILSGGPARLAQIAGCSVAHLNRVVRQAYGMTSTELINQLRLERAAHRLRMSDDPIARVALDCGYDNLGYFYRRFTRRFHATPRRYRLASQAMVR